MTDTPRSERTRPAATETMAVLPLRDIVVFPHMIVPLFVGREKSVRALEAVMKDDKQILLVAQRMPRRTSRRPTTSIAWEPCRRSYSC